MKQLFVDLETTGVDLEKHGVWQIAGHVVIDDEEKERFNLLCQPLKGQLVAADAMTATNMTIERLRTLPEPRTTFVQLKKILTKYVDKYDKKDKFVLIGYNCYFDSNFLRRWFENLGDVYYGSWFWHPPIDLVNLLMFMLHERREELENFKQSTVATYLGVDFKGEAHDADNDVDVTRRLFKLLLETRSSQLTLHHDVSSS